MNFYEAFAELNNKKLRTVERISWQDSTYITYGSDGKLSRYSMKTHESIRYFPTPEDIQADDWTGGV